MTGLTSLASLTSCNRQTSLAAAPESRRTCSDAVGRQGGREGSSAPAGLTDRIRLAMCQDGGRGPCESRGAADMEQDDACAMR